MQVDFLTVNTRYLKKYIFNLLPGKFKIHIRNSLYFPCFFHPQINIY